MTRGGKVGRWEGVCRQEPGRDAGARAGAGRAGGAAGGSPGCLPGPGLSGSCRNRVEREEDGEPVSSRPGGGSASLPGQRGARRAAAAPCLSVPARWSGAARRWQRSRAPRPAGHPQMPLGNPQRGGGDRGPSCSPPASFVLLSPFPSGAFSRPPVSVPLRTLGAGRGNAALAVGGLGRMGLPALGALAQPRRVTSCARCQAEPGRARRCSPAPPGPSGLHRPARRAW